MSPGFSVVAVIAAYNEADIIEPVVRDLIDQGVSVYFIDDGSTDGTVNAIQPFVGHGVLGIEQYPDSGDAFNWERILCRKAALASQLDADWFIHHDADEIRESPWAGVPLKDAIRRVDALGYNAIDFVSLDFRPTDDSFRAGADPRTSFSYYSKAADYDRVQIRAWKKQRTPVDLTSSGGHEAQFDDRRVFPVRFLSRHYPIRGQAHGERKVFGERLPRFNDSERGRGWHVQYDTFGSNSRFIRDANALQRFDPDDVHIDVSLRDRDVEALEQSQLVLRHNLKAARSDIKQRASEVEALRDRLAQRETELEARTRDLRAHSAELEARTAEVESFKRSLSWRWTAPARALYRLLRGR